MRLVLDEKLKNRLVGMAVIIALVVIFAPAIMRKSSQKLEGNFNVTVTLPKKPLAPDVSAVNEKELFKTIKIARVDIPNVSNEKQVPQFVEAKSISAVRSELSQLESSAKKIIHEAANNSVKNEIQIAAANVKKPVQQSSIAYSKVVPNAIQTAKNSKIAAVKRNVQVVDARQLKKSIYMVQLASFAKLSNAQSLVKRLQDKGYKANVVKTSNQSGPIYKVCAGYSANRDDIVKLQGQLAGSMQLNGFIVHNEVS